MMTSGEIANQFQTSWATISRHLGILAAPEVVLAERNGQSIRYELNTTVFHQLVEHLMEWTQADEGGE